MYTMVEYVHERMNTYPKHDIGVDFTMGQGNDTLALSKICDEVYSFDIQEEAIKATREKVSDDYVHLILDGHEHCDRYIQEFDIGIFNLGYLPAHDHLITTHQETTMIALEKAVKMMRQVLFVVCYIGHEEGAREAQSVENYCAQLDRHRYNVALFKMLNKPLAPYVIEIEKR